VPSVSMGARLVAWALKLLKHPAVRPEHLRCACLERACGL
jgi:hypothetical protein